jgi:hypothetical protein
LLNNEDLAELLESTRQRIGHMGGDSPAAQGVAHVLDGMIAMLRDQAPTEAPRVNATKTVETLADEESTTDAPAPPARRVTPVRFRAQESSSASNPLLSPQYAGFFQKLVADQKAPAEVKSRQDESEADEEQSEIDEKPAAPAPSAKPKFSNFFDALVRTQSASPDASQDAGNDEPKQVDSPRSAPSNDPDSSAATGFRDETATG